MLTLLSFHKTLKTVKNKRTFTIYAIFNLQSLLSCNNYYEVSIYIKLDFRLTVSLYVCVIGFLLYIFMSNVSVGCYEFFPVIIFHPKLLNAH